MKHKLLSGLLLALLLLPGCGNGTASNSSTTTESSDTTRLSALFSDRDLDPSYDETDSTTIVLAGDSASADRDSVTIDGSTSQNITMDSLVYGTGTGMSGGPDGGGGAMPNGQPPQ